MEFIQALKSRHSEYQLSKNIGLSDDALLDFLKEILTYTPSAFNSQSQRILVLMGQAHDRLWDELIDIMKGIVQADKFEKTKEKINGFKKAYGTILFFEDQTVIEDLQERFPLYKDNFAKWSIEQNAMLQSNVWVGLKTKDIGASLQHYNELIESFVIKHFDLPKSWALKSQMPFGHIDSYAEAKDHIDPSKRMMVKKTS